MRYDKRQIAQKLIRWERFVGGFCLPNWDELPQIALYMDQVITLINGYLGFFAFEGSGEKLLTPSMVNNYVKTKLLPPPVGKKYGRGQVARLIMICTFKQSLGMAAVRELLPSGGEEAVRRDYGQFIAAHRRLLLLFAEQVKASAASVFDETADTGTEVNDLVVASAVAASFGRLLAEKIVSLRLPEPDEPAETEPPQAG